MPGDLHDRLVRLATEAGFPASGGVDFESAREWYEPHSQRYVEWISKGYAAEMGYLVRGQDRRRDPRMVFPETQSVFCVLSPYWRQPVGETEPSRGVRYARYLKGADYHDTVVERLNTLMQKAAEQDPGLRWKVCVDTSAVLERTWASLCGLGWIGKNTLLIHPKLGSYTFIGVVFLNRTLGQGVRTQANLCGHCEACLKSCPTDAFGGPGWLNSNRCISYLTLEKRGEWTDEQKQRVEKSNFVAGCDICQEVCPFNFKPSREEISVMGSDATEGHATWQSLEAESVETYRSRVRESALSRVKPEQFVRNWRAIQMAHSPRTRHRKDP
jgi:epoxyqueuosine reductase